MIFLIVALRKTKISNDYLDIYTITHIHITVNVQLGQAGGQREPPAGLTQLYLINREYHRYLRFPENWYFFGGNFS